MVREQIIRIKAFLLPLRGRGQGWVAPWGVQGLQNLWWPFVLVLTPVLVFLLRCSPPVASIINRPPSYLILPQMFFI